MTEIYQEYVKGIWCFRRPSGELIPRQEWYEQNGNTNEVNTDDDGNVLTEAELKAVSVGLGTPTNPHFPANLPNPVILTNLTAHQKALNLLGSHEYLKLLTQLGIVKRSESAMATSLAEKLAHKPIGAGKPRTDLRCSLEELPSDRVELSTQDEGD